MSIRPRDLDEFFCSLGEKRVQKGVINRELTGDDLAAAKLWLDQHRARTVARLTRWGIGMTLMTGLLALAASFLAS